MEEFFAFRSSCVGINSNVAARMDPTHHESDKIISLTRKTGLGRRSIPSNETPVTDKDADDVEDDEANPPPPDTKRSSSMVPSSIVRSSTVQNRLLMALRAPGPVANVTENQEVDTKLVCLRKEQVF